MTMDLNTLEYANFALKSLVDNKPVENFVFHDALNGISDFLKSEMDEKEKDLVNRNIDVFRGITNIFKIYHKGGSCIREIIEANYMDFNSLVEKLREI